MARTAVPVTVVTRAGVTLPAPVAGDPVNNHVISNDGSVLVQIQNSDAAAHTVTFHLTATVDGFAVTPRTASIPANTTMAFGPFAPNDYGVLLLVDVDNAGLKLSATKS